tara:strand:- start:412 stop:951 length:540 start_codon:yes stop_codon:yes gene_type:complete
MKTRFHIKLKDYFWIILKKITNTYSHLKVINLGNGHIKCFWQISTMDNLRIELSKSCFYAIRLFDITNKRNKNYSTCIMKEIQVNKFKSSVTFPIPINKGMYYFEFGYRKKNGEWRKLAFQELNLGYRIKKLIRDFDNDTWFSPNKKSEETYLSFHENAYQLSLNTTIGGSEKIINEND